MLLFIIRRHSIIGRSIVMLTRAGTRIPRVIYVIGSQPHSLLVRGSPHDGETATTTRDDDDDDENDDDCANISRCVCDVFTRLGRIIFFSFIVATPR